MKKRTEHITHTHPKKKKNGGLKVENTFIMIHRLLLEEILSKLYILFSLCVPSYIHIGLILKVFINQSCFLAITICPMITPIANPNSYPIKTIFQPNSNGDAEFQFSSKIERLEGGSLEFLHFLFNGLPHKLGFPSKELFLNVSSCLPCGIGPMRLL
jgi:hypothetical protein